MPDSVPKQLQVSFGAFVEWLLPLDIDAAIGFDVQATHSDPQVPYCLHFICLEMLNTNCFGAFLNLLLPLDINAAIGLEP